ncbi:MarR family winged helix-turn-helix transcriptional regulator [Streptomyces arenae]|uniref:MarR family winged helix-turn-helix transcriptional regulator n=1 Tax=Streptomyces arenae TaxID=29301 RepID=UPI00265A29FF|nr:MarR family transcriptional regulator [Streptomyces arenae]MCG7205135.1 MarR family transcriptional regulator [Streptomyces arenae]
MSDEQIDWLSPEELRVFRAFNRSWEAVSARLDADMERETGLPRTYFDILWRLRRAPDRSLRMSRLAEITHSKASRITHAVGRLEAAGLVLRVVPEGDRRGWLAVLTDEGLRQAEKAAPVYARSVRDHVLAPLTTEARGQLTAIGETLLARLDPEALPGAGDKEERS